MTRNILKTEFGVPTKETVDYNRIYEYDAFELGNDVFVKYFNNRGGRDDAMINHVKKLKDSIIKSGGYSLFPPIIVDINTLQIADGNSRWEAIMQIVKNELMDKLTFRVMFYDIPADKFDETVILFNMDQKSWTLLDFIYNYSNRGFDSFTKFISFCDSHESLKNGKNINPRYGGAILKIPTTWLKRTDLLLTDEDIERGETVEKEATDIRLLFSPNPKANGGGWYEPYLRAWSEFSDVLNEKKVLFENYLKEVKITLKNRKSQVTVPYGSNKKQDWTTFFRAILSYC